MPESAPVESPPLPAPARPVGSAASLRRRRRRDRMARAAIVAGGVAIIASVIGIFVFLGKEALPLLRGARVQPARATPLAASAALALTIDESRTWAASLGSDGIARVARIGDGTVAVERSCFSSIDGALPAVPVRAAPITGGDGFVAASGDGRLAVIEVRFEVDHDGETARVEAGLAEPAEYVVDPTGAPLAACAASARDRSLGIAGQRGDGTIVLITREVEENMFTGELTARDARRELPAPGPATHLALDTRREHLYGATADGRLLTWDLAGDGPPAATWIGAPVTALALLIGDQSLAVGRADGSLAIWNRVRQPDGSFELTRTHDFPALDAAVTCIAPGWRDRTFLAASERGGLLLGYSTTTRVLWQGELGAPAPSAIALAPKGDGFYASAAGSLAAFDLENRHPEAGWGTFFGAVWYEGEPGPQHVYQSSSGSDEAEPKFGMVPLLVGTLKATIYSLLFAVPLALLGAMYTSQFMHWSLRAYVKPAVEIMASLPSVVLGFIAGTWLAPRVTRDLLAVPLFLLLAPAAVIGAGELCRRLPARIRHRFHDGAESLGFIAVLALALGASILLVEPLEDGCFGGDFVAWIRGPLGVAYDPKNCIVLGMAMGIAVIPIIFSIAEDAFSNVPKSLISGSLALGADRWFTVTRIVLPTASPGLFSAVMIGFGRAVGETMIVVMASGNTPILDWSPFNGMRTLSANIATEVPEAAQGSTLYRTLFVAALLLFALTFVANTAAELVRQHLRQKYARL